MTDGTVVLVSQVVTLLGTIIAAAASIRAANLGAKNATKLHVLHLSINSRLDSLVAAEKEVSFTEGMAKGTANERANPLEQKS